jgi:hypothetical protein
LEKSYISQNVLVHVCLEAPGLIEVPNEASIAISAPRRHQFEEVCRFLVRRCFPAADADRAPVQRGSAHLAAKIAEIEPRVARSRPGQMEKAQVSQSLTILHQRLVKIG